MDDWRGVWRAGLAPEFSDAELSALATGLESGTEMLTQGQTTKPGLYPAVLDWPVEAACAVGFVCVQRCGGWGVATVADVSEEFARVCYRVETREGVWSLKPFLWWWDTTERGQAMRELAGEVRAELGRRGAAAA